MSRSDLWPPGWRLQTVDVGDSILAVSASNGRESVHGTCRLSPDDLRAVVLSLAAMAWERHLQPAPFLEPLDLDDRREGTSR